METSKSDRDAMIDLLYDIYDADLVDVALETLGENELFDGIPAILEDYCRQLYGMDNQRRVGRDC